MTAFVQHPSQTAHCAQLIPVKVARRLHNQQLKACECCGSPQPSAFNICLNNITRRRVAVPQPDLRGMVVRRREEDLIFEFGVLVLNYSWLKLTYWHTALVGRPPFDVRYCLMMFWCLSDVSCHYVTPARIAKTPTENKRGKKLHLMLSPWRIVDPGVPL